MKGLHNIEMAERLDAYLIEDICAAAPDVQILTLYIIETEEIDLSLFTDLSSLVSLTLGEGKQVQRVSLNGARDLEDLTGIEVNLNPETPIPCLDLRPLRNHSGLRVVTIATPTRKLEGLDALSTLPNLESLGFYALELPKLDLSPLSNGPKMLESIYLGSLGQEESDSEFRLKLPIGIPLKLVEITDFKGNEGRLRVDFSFLRSIESIDNLTFRNCGLTSFDMKVLAHLKRVGSLDLTANGIQRLNITPILAIPMFTERALGQDAFAIDPDVIIQISKSRKNDVSKLTSMEATIIPEHDGHFAIEYEFGHEWLEKILADHSIEWV